ncbi:hypothetical protein ACFO0A_14045, partial [Novosphingobium tardum]
QKLKVRTISSSERADASRRFGRLIDYAAVSSIVAAAGVLLASEAAGVLGRPLVQIRTTLAHSR